MFWIEIGGTFLLFMSILFYLNKTPPKTIDSIAPTELKIKANTIARHKIVIFITLIFAGINFLIAEIILLKKTEKNTTCLNKIKQVANKVAVITTDGRYGMVIKKEK
jgi:hypothetical protein